MTDNYGGESVGKKLARFSFWDRARLWLGPRFLTEKHLVLASREGGDISVLRGFGVQDSNIIAVDLNAASAAKCAAAYPSVKVIHGEAGAIARKYRGELASAFLDFCCWPTDDAITTVFQVCAHGLRNNSVLGYAFMRGRESQETFRRIQGHIETEQWLRADHEARLRRIGIELPSDVRTSTADGRAAYIYDAIQSRLMASRAAIFTLGRINYHSSCAWRRGVPMTIWAKWVHRESTSTSIGAFTNRCRSITNDWCDRISAANVAALRDTDFAAPYDAPRREFMVDYRGGQAMTPFEATFDREFLTMRALVDSANEIDREFPGRAHLLLNVSKPRLAAWRAHRTMGTYDKAS